MVNIPILSELAFGRPSLIALLSVHFLECIFSLSLSEKSVVEVCHENNINLQVAEVFLQNDFYSFILNVEEDFHMLIILFPDKCVPDIPQSWQPIYWDKQRLISVTCYQSLEDRTTLRLTLFSLQRMNHVFTVFSIESKCGIMSITSKVWAYMLTAYPFRVSCYPAAKHLYYPRIY